MKLLELNGTNNPVFAWLDPARGPENLKGVRLAYILPYKQHLAKIRQDAEAKGDERRLQNIERMEREQAKSGQKALTPDLGWWMNKEDFYADKEGFGGAMKSRVYTKHPGLQIMNSREEAFQAAEQAGLFD